MKPRSGAGRHDLLNVPTPPGGLDQEFAARSPAIGQEQFGSWRLGVVAVPDPYQPERRIRARARFDLLDRERARGFLDEASYLAGREIEATFESMARLRSTFCSMADHIDAAAKAELATLCRIDQARTINNFLCFLVRQVGRSDTKLLWYTLGERLPFSVAAAMFGRSGIRGLRYTMDRWRDALTTIANTKAAHGRAVP